MFSKKGQSALEYLMTYGWALVVIVIVIAALVFLIQRSQVGGNTCSATSGILITNHQLSEATDLQLALSNQTAATVDGNIAVTGTIGGTTVAITPDPTTFSLGTTQETETVAITTPATIDTGDTYSLSVTFTYPDRDGFARTVTSTCNGTTS